MKYSSTQVSKRSSLRRNISLARAISKLGYSSRSQAVVLIRDGHVRLNGKVVKNPNLRCSPSRDKIVVNGIALQPKQFTYIMMNKPEGVITTRSDEEGRPTVYDFLRELDQWVFPVGRLDKDTSGLLLLTNDNQLGEKLTNPRSKIPKTYLAALDKSLTDQDRRIMERGMALDGEKLLPAKVRVKEGASIEMTICEGKNRQVRRMCESLGYEVRKLVRIKIGNFVLKDLQPGKWRYLSDKEISRMLSS